jgi:hypothetical protein
MRQRPRQCGLERLQNGPAQTADYADFTGDERKTLKESIEKTGCSCRL